MTEAGHGVAGTWRAVLASPGGELPFTLRIAPAGTWPPAVAITGAEAVAFTDVTQQGRHVHLAIAGFDSAIDADLAADGRALRGAWTRRARGPRTRLDFQATRDDDRRFAPLPADVPRGRAAVPSVAGAWLVTFNDEDGDVPGRGEFREEPGPPSGTPGGKRVTGTFLTTTGDLRYLEGEYADGVLRLSCFDGSHAFLFHARAQADGTLAGDWWSRDIYHATWQAHRPRPEPPPRPGGANPPAALVPGLPDPWHLVQVTSPDRRLHFTFLDLVGRPVSLDDERYRGKVVVVNLFGSWCPNCNDEAPLLTDWAKRHGPRGLEVVGLAFEMTGEVDSDREMVRRFVARHGTPYPVLLAGTSDKTEATAVMPDLTKVEAFPMTIFVGRDGTVRHVHTGFAGPGTGAYQHMLRGQFDQVLESLLAEPAP